MIETLRSTLKVRTFHVTRVIVKNRFSKCKYTGRDSTFHNR